VERQLAIEHDVFERPGISPTLFKTRKKYIARCKWVSCEDDVAHYADDAVHDGSGVDCAQRRRISGVPDHEGGVGGDGCEHVFEVGTVLEIESAGPNLV